MKPKITRDSDSSIIGQTELFLPRQVASLYSSYVFRSAVLQGFSLGGDAAIGEPANVSLSVRRKS